MNDADACVMIRPAMRWIVGGKPAQDPQNLPALADLSGQWIDLVHGHRGIVLDMDSSVSPTQHGEQENSVWNGHYACNCYQPLFVFNQFGDLERCALRPGNVHSVTKARFRASISGLTPALPIPRSTSFSKRSGSSMRSCVYRKPHRHWFS